MNGQDTATVTDNRISPVYASSERRQLPSSRNRQPRIAWIAAALSVVLILGVSWIVERVEHSPAVTATSPAAPSPVLSGDGIVGHEIARTEDVTYPAHSSTQWTPESGLHEVTVVKGTVTIEGVDANTSHHGPGASYVAGWTPYVLRNDLGDTVEVRVSYLRETPQAQQDNHVTPSD